MSLELTRELKPGGIICVNKPAGITSFGVVARVRRLLNVKKIGHGGTLDPMATGVLPLFVGAATRVIDFLPDSSKAYIARFKLGIVTDTQDISGTVTQTRDMGEYAVTLRELRDTATLFRGEIQQVPPMFSAVKSGGKRLYELAREGREVVREARTRAIHDIDIPDYDETAHTGTLTMSCSAGTYVRTVIHDIGERLGCGGVMTALTRTYAHGFTLADCVELDDITPADLRPVDEAFVTLPSYALSDTDYDDLYCGRELTADDTALQAFPSGGVITLKYKDRLTAFATVADTDSGVGDTTDTRLKILRRLTRDE